MTFLDTWRKIKKAPSILNICFTKTDSQIHCCETQISTLTQFVSTLRNFNTFDSNNNLLHVQYSEKTRTFATSVW